MRLRSLLAADYTGVTFVRKLELDFEKYKYRKIGGWNQASFKKGKAVIEVDVTPVCKDATQY